MNCPKCGAPIKRFDLAQNCRQCGVNILYYSQERDLARDAKKCELEFAKARAVVGKIKTTYIGSALAITRLATGVLSVACLAIPFMKLSINLPLVSADISTGAIGIYKMISNGIYTQLFNLMNAGVDGAVAKAAMAHLVFLALTVIAELCMFINYLLAAINIRRGSKWLAVFSACSFTFNLGTIATQFIAMADAKTGSSVNAAIYPGAFVMAAIVGIFFVSTLLLYKKNPQVEISEIDAKRIDLLKKVKAGDVNIDDLSLPVFETEEEKEKRKNLFGIASEVTADAARKEEGD